MRKFEGTQGMWIVGTDIYTECIAVMPESIFTGSNEVICILPSNDSYDDMDDMDSSGPEIESNARLIAAAPELLNACIEALNYVSCEEPAFDTLKSAIHNALGKEVQP